MSRRPGGLWRGTVERVAADGRVYVKVDRLNRGHVYGPCDVGEGAWADLELAETAVGDHGAHTHAKTSPAPLAKGNRVLVGFLEDRPDDLVVLCRLRP